MKRNSNNVDSDAPTKFTVSSDKRYKQLYNKFQAWKASQSETSNLEAVVVSYFKEIVGKQVSTLYASFSMLRTTLKVNDNVDIGTYPALRTLLKEADLNGYKSNRSKAFTEDEIKKFINEAPDETWLDVKVIEFRILRRTNVVIIF